jgi:hypothetical protein
MCATVGRRHYLCERSLTTSPKEAISTELESFLKELAAELHITPEAAEQIWKDYHSNKEMTRDKVHEQLVSEQPQLKPP